MEIKTWDVFDTLIARRYVNNDPIIKTIESISKINGFFVARKNADNGQRSLLQIYENLADQDVISKNQIHELYRLEVDLEKQNTFGIAENINQVSENDFLISDMYLSGADILELVRNAGLKKQVTIYQSSGDKRNNAVWEKLKDLGIKQHCGDNQVSDVENPKRYNIPVKGYYNSINSSTIETSLFDSGLRILSYLVREVRLKSDNTSDLFKLSNQINLPWLLISCELLNRKYAGKNLVFLGRDCQLLYKVYNKFYGGAYYLPFSRKVAYEQPEDSVNYLKAHLPPNYVMVDISSTGATWQKINSLHKFDIEVLIYSDQFHYSSEKPVLPEGFSFTTKNSIIGQTNEMIEVLNCADHGVLTKIINHNDIYIGIFGDTEIDSDSMNTIHSAIDMAVDACSYHKENIRKELQGAENLLPIFGKLLNIMNVSVGAIRTIPNYLEKQNAYMKEVKNAQNR